MNPFVASLKWDRKAAAFTYKEYDRTHEVTYGSGATIRASAAPDFLGKAELVNPEETLVGAASSCHMLTFLAIAARKKLTLDKYVDVAHGVLEKGAGGKFWVSKITLKPEITWAPGVTVDAETMKALHHEAHENCFIANSVKSAIVVEV